MEIRSGSLGFGTLAAGLFLMGAFAVGHATWAIQNGASPGDEGIASFGPSGKGSRRGTRVTLQTQRAAGGVGMVVGAVAGGLTFVFPILMKEDDEQ